MANTSIYNAFERMWTHVVAKLGEKSDVGHEHDFVTEITYGTPATYSHTFDEIKEAYASGKRCIGLLNADGYVSSCEASVSDNVIDFFFEHPTGDNGFKHYRFSLRSNERSSSIINFTKGASNGIPTLNSNLKVPISQLPAATSISSVATTDMDTTIPTMSALKAAIDDAISASY